MSPKCTFMFNICFIKHSLNIYKPLVDVIKSPNVKWWLFIIYNCQLRWPQSLFMVIICFTKHSLNIYKQLVDVIKSPNVKWWLFIIYKCSYYLQLWTNMVAITGSESECALVLSSYLFSSFGSYLNSCKWMKWN